ncbi:uncharacterized protein BDR25DRAFT_358607 [Lindgomyces ingoldianus]|uniref:Uncharacterized protein n=1 Tax=Lindgomyces ingoldianus TaxID=673940 RepID=A0ACB6QKQ7_9PLEO|nr:uncharacterized protein BDR25DRAFT_358607 [Lindgomyces ingoldianus]KAF2467490.1 hypothetical protein BDR25DRAFT_358607 [Lindgomyces ingoldianus]
MLCHRSGFSHVGMIDPESIRIKTAVARNISLDHGQDGRLSLTGSMFICPFVLRLLSITTVSKPCLNAWNSDYVLNIAVAVLMPFRGMTKVDKGAPLWLVSDGCGSIEGRKVDHAAALPEGEVERMDMRYTRSEAQLQLKKITAIPCFSHHPVHSRYLKWIMPPNHRSTHSDCKLPCKSAVETLDRSPKISDHACEVTSIDGARDPKELNKRALPFDSAILAQLLAHRLSTQSNTATMMEIFDDPQPRETILSLQIWRLEQRVLQLELCNRRLECTFVRKDEQDDRLNAIDEQVECIRNDIDMFGDRILDLENGESRGKLAGPSDADIAGAAALIKLIEALRKLTDQNGVLARDKAIKARIYSKVYCTDIECARGRGCLVSSQWFDRNAIGEAPNILTQLNSVFQGSVGNQLQTYYERNSWVIALTMLNARVALTAFRGTPCTATLPREFGWDESAIFLQSVLHARAVLCFVFAQSSLRAKSAFCCLLLPSCSMILDNGIQEPFLGPRGTHVPLSGPPLEPINTRVLVRSRMCLISGLLSSMDCLTEFVQPHMHAVMRLRSAMRSFRRQANLLPASNVGPL